MYFQVWVIMVVCMFAYLGLCIYAINYYGNMTGKKPQSMLGALIGGWGEMLAEAHVVRDKPAD